VVLLFKDQLHQVVVAQGGKRGRQTHSADCMPAGQLPQGANQLQPRELLKLRPLIIGGTHGDVDIN
jgi:hypothetical protein